MSGRWLIIRYSFLSAFFVMVVAILVIILNVDPSQAGLLLTYSMQFYTVTVLGEVSIFIEHYRGLIILHQ